MARSMDIEDSPGLSPSGFSPSGSQNYMRKLDNLCNASDALLAAIQSLGASDAVLFSRAVSITAVSQIITMPRWWLPPDPAVLLSMLLRGTVQTEPHCCQACSCVKESYARTMLYDSRKCSAQLLALEYNTGLPARMLNVDTVQNLDFCELFHALSHLHVQWL